MGTTPGVTIVAKKSVQEFLPGLAPEKNPKVHKQALLFMQAKDEAKLAAKKAKEAGAQLVFIMHDQKVDHYAYGDLDVKIDLKSTAKAKKIVADKPKKPRKKKDDAKEETNKPDLKIA